MTHTGNCLSLNIAKIKRQRYLIMFAFVPILTPLIFEESRMVNFSELSGGYVACFMPTLFIIYSIVLPFYTAGYFFNKLKDHEKVILRSKIGKVTCIANKAGILKSKTKRLKINMTAQNLALFSTKREYHLVFLFSNIKSHTFGELCSLVCPVLIFYCFHFLIKRLALFTVRKMRF